MKVTLKVIKDLIVAKIGVFGQIEDGFFLTEFIIFLVEDFNLSTIDKVHLFDTTFVADDGLARVLDSAVKADDQFIDKALLTLLKEMVEIFFKFFELVGWKDQLRLHFWRNLLEELEFFNH